VAREASRLRATVSQLEHALTARVRVEQAIGVLAERHRILPRQAFEQLRSAARNRGRRVIDIAADVVASATNPLLQLPDELSRPRSSGRNRSRPPQSALETK
jgi:AmiR/NasT family two-component response regulator